MSVKSSISSEMGFAQYYTLSDNCNYCGRFQYIQDRHYQSVSIFCLESTVMVNAWLIYFVCDQIWTVQWASSILCASSSAVWFRSSQLYDATFWSGWASASPRVSVEALCSPHIILQSSDIVASSCSSSAPSIRCASFPSLLSSVWSHQACTLSFMGLADALH